VESEIGNTLRDARNRRKIDLSDVEAATKIRVRFLRAIENEEWDVLPGDTYARAFIRTYAGYLGLDGERLAEDYRTSMEAVGGDRPPPPLVEPALSGRRWPGTRSPVAGRILAVAVVAALIGILVAIGLASGGDDSPDGAGSASGTGRAHTQQPPKAAPGVAVSLEATGEVWVCMLDAQEKPVINGQILPPGAQEGPFRSNGFTVAFGNGAVEMDVDSSPAPLPDSSSPIGFAVDSEGKVTELEEGERPDCA
jgi:cytoskeleton protein RodZ